MQCPMPRRRTQPHRHPPQLDATSFEWLLRVAKPQEGHVDYGEHSFD